MGIYQQERMRAVDQRVTVGIDPDRAGGLVAGHPLGEHQHRRARTGPRHPGM